MSTRIPAEIIDRASDWLVALREPELSAPTREAFADWLRESPIHVQAYLEIAGIWGDATQISRAEDFDIRESLRAGDVAGNVARLGGPIPESARKSAVPQTASRNARRQTILGLAAAVFVAIGFGAFVALQEHQPVYEADIGEQRLVTLQDGSLVHLNSRSRLRLGFARDQRVVELLEGQALFEVAKDPSRPFIVRSGAVSVRAVGTKFDVYWKESGTLVTVVEGKVEIESADSGTKVGANAGEQVTVQPSGRMARLEVPNVVAATSWIQQQLIFTGERLDVVVDEFNRYTRRPIVLADPSLAELRVNAVFHTTNPESLLRFVERFPGVVVIESASGVRITHRDPDA